jgi:tetratricopeptide (TPR) repeat protein
MVGLAALPAVGALDASWHDKWFAHDRSDNRIAYEYAYNILAGLDQGAIVFTNGDNDTFPIWYLQEVEHFRRDVSVVNLSLVNLAWYVKQLKRFDPPVPMNYSNEEIDELRAVGYRDPETGELQVIMVREYVVADIIDANRKQADPRPVFFAVTIPRENMERYHPFLQMEGLAYRLTEQRAPDGIPETDPDRLLANVFGAYRFDALTTGDTAERKRRFDAQVGHAGEVPRHRFLTGVDEPLPVDYWQLLDLVGERRRDVFVNRDTRNLLGNYPASIARAGFTYLARAEELRQADGSFQPTDEAAYDEYTGNALLCYELALRLDPDNQLVAAGYYPSLLIERGQTERALAYLERIHGRLEPDIERSAVLNGLRGLISLEQEELAIAWLEERLAAEPGWRLGYELLIRIHESLGDVAAAVAVADLYRERTGQDDPALRQYVEEIRQRARQQEEDRLREELQQRDVLPEGRR